jgi:hypothetical protein
MKEYEKRKITAGEIQNEIHIQNKIQVQPIDNSLNRLILKLGKETQINHHSWKEHSKLSKIAKFGCKML